MASLESLQARAYSAETKSGRTVDDKSLAIEIVHVATGATPSVTVVSATGITLADADYTTGSLDFATYTTLGTLVDEINNNHNLYWSARIIDGLRSTSTASSVLIPNSAITAVTRGGETIYEVFMDQSVNDTMFFRVAADRGVLRDDNANLRTNVPGGSRRVKIQGIVYRANISAGTANGLRIYEYNPVGDVETQIYQWTTVDDTETTIDLTDFPITAGYGNELIVMLNDSAITDATTNFLQVDYTRE
jgi:hypothetical protein